MKQRCTRHTFLLSVLCSSLGAACAGSVAVDDAAVASDAGTSDAALWSGPLSPRPLPVPAGNTVVVLPDTQFYACAYPEIFGQQTQWIAEHVAERSIVLVAHTGDIVDEDVPAQWDVAAESMHALDGRVPYLLTTGNHDLRNTRASLIDDYFDETGLDAYEWTAGLRDPEHIDNSFGIVELAGRPWIFIGIEFAPRDEVVQWAAGVLAAHAELPAVLFTHAYVDGDGRRFDRSIVPLQLHHPDAYGITPEQGVNDGEDLWRKLVQPHENVRLVLSGHVIPDGTARSPSVRASGSQVHEVLANYQQCALCPCSEVEGGRGYLRVLEFEPTGTRVHVSTYSPYLNAALTDEENDFVLEWE